MPTAATPVTGRQRAIIFLEGGRLQEARVVGRGSSNYRIALADGQQRRLPIAKALAEVEAAACRKLLADAGERLAAVSVSELHRRCAGRSLSAERLARLVFDDADPASLIAIRAALVADPGFFVCQGELHQPVPAAQAAAVIEGRRRRELAAQRQRQFMERLERDEVDDQIAAAALAFIEKRHDPASDAFRVLRRHSCIVKEPIHSLAVRWGLVADEHELYLRMALADIPVSPPQPRQQDEDAAGLVDLDSLPLLADDAFSIDGAGTLEIDDAFSIRRSESGGWQVGIHIAAPALNLPPAAASQAAQRMTSVYLPDRKIMQFPEQVVRTYALTAGSERPAISLLQDFDPDSGRLGKPDMKIGRVRVAANLSLEDFIGWQPGDAGEFSEQLAAVSSFSATLPSGRNKRALERSFIVRVSDGSVPHILPRAQLGVIDAVVAALMVHYNQCGTDLLRAARAARLLRSSGRNLVRDGIEQRQQEYAWLSSPLRRYIDLLNQQQLVAALSGRPPPHDAAFMRRQSLEYDLRAAAARRAQQLLERYWTFRWLQQRVGQSFAGTVSGCRRSVNLDDLPVAVKIRPPAAADVRGRVRVKVREVDLLELVARGQLCA